MEGPMFFGSVEQLEAEFDKTGQQAPQQKIKVFSLKGVGNLDLAGADFLINRIRQARKRGGSFHIVAMYPSLLTALRRMHVIDELGENHLHVAKGHAIGAAVAAVDPAICASCVARVCSECDSKPAPAGLSSSTTPTKILRE